MSGVLYATASPFVSKSSNVGDDDDICGGYANSGEPGVDDLPDARGQNDQGNSAVVEMIKKTARTFSEARPLFADNPMNDSNIELVFEQQIELAGPPLTQVEQLLAPWYIRRAFDSAIAVKQLPVMTSEGRSEMSAVRNDRTR